MKTTHFLMAVMALAASVMINACKEENTPPCSDFNPGAIATAGQMLSVGGTPATIHSEQDASGGGEIIYQWYKDGGAISGATEAYYTPPPEDATETGIYTYTRRAKDKVCNMTLIPSVGSWVLVVCSDFNPGAIATAGQVLSVGGTPATIENIMEATGGGAISYQWYKNGNVIDGATAASYTPPKSAATATGVHTYTRRAKDNVCNTTFTSSAGSWVLTVVNCPLTQLPVTSTFAGFPSNYSASTYVTLTDERDNKNYNAVKIGGRWIMAQNLNYQKDLTWQANSNQPTTASDGGVTALIGHFWCPGVNTTSTKTSCDVWGALYSWETAMMVDGKWSNDDRNATGWSEPAYSANTGTGNTNNGGRGANSHGICPPNWHVPTDAEWGEVLNSMESNPANQTHNSGEGTMGVHAGTHGKSVCRCASRDDGCATDANVSWPYGGGGTDAFNFRVLPAGNRNYTGSYFFSRGHHAEFWSSSAYDGSSAWYRVFNYTNDTVVRYSNYRSFGFSVRCIRDL
jgi:uncharacterized protein (TIGR02145 family)